MKGGNYFGVPGRMNLPDLPYEKRAFVSCDVNKDGSLNVDEVYNLLRKSDPSITPMEARQIFDACDQNQDAKIDFEELRNYLHPATANENSAQRKRFKDIFMVKTPGPLDYELWQHSWECFFAGRTHFGPCAKKMAFLFESMFRIEDFYWALTFYMNILFFLYKGL